MFTAKEDNYDAIDATPTSDQYMKMGKTQADI